MSDVLVNDEVEALVLASRAGDQAAWGTLVERLTPLVFNVARTYGLERQDAIDVSQTTWLQFARHVATLNEPRKAPGWLATTARRECARIVRAQQRETVTTPDDLTHYVTDLRPDDAVEADAERRMIWQAVENLPESCRALVRLLLTEPTPSYETVAEIIGISVNAVGPKRTRCLGYLRTTLNELFGDERNPT